MGLPENYRDQLIKLLPRGPIWNIEVGSWAYKFFHSLAEEPARIHARALDLLRERDPNKAVELLAEYERELDIPGPCGDLADNLADRRTDIIAKIVSTGGQSKQYFIDVAAQAGISITITTYPQVFAGTPCGVSLTNGPWLYTWKITSPNQNFDYFQAGISSAGDQLVSETSSENLRCFFDRIKPAHTYAVYAFGV